MSKELSQKSASYLTSAAEFTRMVCKELTFLYQLRTSSDSEGAEGNFCGPTICMTAFTDLITPTAKPRFEYMRINYTKVTYISD